MAVPAHPRLAALIVMRGEPHYVVASKARMNPNTLGGIISGRLTPSEDQQQRLATALDTTPDALFESDGTSNP